MQERNRYKSPGTFEECQHIRVSLSPVLMQVVEHPYGHYRCACEGCWACKGKELDCTCDVDWDAMYESNRS